jgi:hypothetical protein
MSLLLYNCFDIRETVLDVCLLSTHNDVNANNHTRRHVFRDLRPYICTVEGCTKSEYLFAPRHDWFQHEADVRRREWYCSPCDEAFSVREHFGGHLEKKKKKISTPIYSHFLLFRLSLTDAKELGNRTRSVPSVNKRKPLERIQRHFGGPYATNRSVCAEIL